MRLFERTFIASFRVKPSAHICLAKRAMSHFNVISHTARCQHTRHWRGAVEPGYEHSLRLAVKQYIPKSNAKPRPGDVTFVAATSNGCPKVGFDVI
jgi:hypothetical protein